MEFEPPPFIKKEPKFHWS